MEGRESIDSKTLFDEMEKQLPYGSKISLQKCGVLSRALNNLKTELDRVGGREENFRGQQ